jgi:tripartite-type tricarboxylate transporter receptor subunit TctC
MAIRITATLLFLSFFAAGAYAQTYPTKPVRLIAAYPPGGSIDIVARLVGNKLTEGLGQQVVVENRSGASGNIGTEHVARATPDGYTLLLGSAPPLAANMYLFTKMPFDPQKDFAPIIRIANQPNVLVLHPSVPASSVKEFIALAKSKPGSLNYGASGLASSHQMCAGLLMMMTGIKMNEVQYKGGGPAMLDLVGGHLDLMIETAPSAIPYVKSGRLKGLAVTSLQRSAMLPAVPTFDESGVKGYEFVSWMGLVAPAAVPAPIIQRLHTEMQKALTGDLRTRLTELGLDPVGGTPEEFAAFIRQDSAKYAKLIQAAGIKPQ